MKIFILFALVFMLQGCAKDVNYGTWNAKNTEETADRFAKDVSKVIKAVAKQNKIKKLRLAINRFEDFTSIKNAGDKFSKELRKELEDYKKINMVSPRSRYDYYLQGVIKEFNDEEGLFYKIYLVLLKVDGNKVVWKGKSNKRKYIKDEE